MITTLRIRQLEAETRVLGVPLTHGQRVDVDAQELATLCSLALACTRLLNAPHHDHFASRLGDEELAAVEQMKRLLQ